jgi:hypothetical protein
MPPVAVAIATLCASLVPAGVRATEYRSLIQLAVGTQVPDAGSHIELTGIRVIRFSPIRNSRDLDSLEDVDAACVQFVNHDERAASRVVVSFSYRTEDGTEVGSDIVDARGRYSKGASIGGTSPPPPPAPRVGISDTCTQVNGFGWGGDAVKHIDYTYGHYQRSLVTVTASVRAVYYYNGTSWRANASATDSG